MTLIYLYIILIDVNAIFNTGCGGELTASSGTIVSPNYPLNYGHNAECYWTVSVARGSRIKVTFNAFETESHEHCNYDYVEVRSKSTY